MKWEFFCFTVLNIFFVTNALGPTDNPYEILGVKKSATVQELRKAYKRLAKEWHPDKNNDPQASSKFVQITQAYELLTDPERRKQFDNHGTINPDNSYRRQDFHFDRVYPINEFFFSKHGFKPPTQNVPTYLFERLSITTRAFENILRPKSFTTPQILFFFSDRCLACIKVEPFLERVVDELGPIGVDLATVHIDQEPLLAKRCSVVSVPALALLIENKLYPYKDSTSSFHKIVHFLRNKFPYKLIVSIREDTLTPFLEGWHDNRVRALLFQKSEPVRLRYLLMAFYYSERVSFGFVLLGSPGALAIQERFKVSADSDTLLLFNENTNRPITSLSMPVIPVQVMKDVIFENKYLILPRLSSQKVLDSVCPVEWASRRKRLCVVLVSENTRDHDEPREVMREFAQESAYRSERVRFSYIYKEEQSEFVNSLLLGSPREAVLNVVILWRRDANRVKYEWMEEKWCFEKSSPEWNRTKEKLESTISKLLRAEETLTYEAVVKELIDEQAQGLMGRIVSKFLIATDILRESLSREHVFVAASVVASIVFIVAGGYLMAYLVRQEEEKLSQNGYHRMTSKANGTTTYIPELKLHELRGEKYNGMVRLLKPGCRTIVLLLDQPSQTVLLPEFHTVVWPYRKNKTLMFGYMYIERGVEWYRRLLMLSLPEPRELVINPKNCIGTVLSLNGHRKYFCMYHAKHPECLKAHGSKRILRMTKSLNRSETAFARLGSFMGFDDSGDSDSDDQVDVEQGTKLLDSDDQQPRILLETNLLTGLPNWLDRLFEGTTHRYHVNYWPDFPTK